jgi:hypothetical protein
MSLMADPTQSAPKLESDAQNWLNDWRSYMEALEKAYGNITSSQQSSGDGGQADTPLAYEVAHNDQFAGIKQNPYIDSDENNNSAVFEGFPSTNQMTTDLLNKIKQALQSKQNGSLDKALAAKEVGKILRQINFLEGFRRAYLARRQRRKHLIQHELASRYQGPILKDEIVRQLIGGSVLPDPQDVTTSK